MLSEVTAFREEVRSIIALSNSSHLPLGYGFLLAEGLRLTPEEVQISRSEEEVKISDRLLGRSRAALRLAAYSSEYEFDANVLIPIVYGKVLEFNQKYPDFHMLTSNRLTSNSSDHF